MDNFGIVLVLLAIFIFPEIKNIFIKKKKYQYPDETTDVSKQDSSELSQQEMGINWDEIFGLEAKTVKTVAIEQEINTETPVEFLREEHTRVVAPENVPIVDVVRRNQAKIAGRQALQGIVMAEIMSKPRAMRPLEKLVFYQQKSR